MLEGERVRPEPLHLEHLDAFCEIGLDPAIWEWRTREMNDRDDMRRYIEAALRDRAAGAALPFVIVARASGAVMGRTRSTCAAAARSSRWARRRRARCGST